MKYLFSITYYSPYISGITIYVQRLAEQLAKRGHKCQILCYQHEASLAPVETIHDVQITRVKPLVRVSKGFLSLDWFTKAANLAKSSDVIVINLPQPEGIALAILGKAYSKKVISVYHCEIDLPPGIGNWLLEQLILIQTYLTFLFSSNIVTYTQDYALSSKAIRPFFGKTSFLYPPIYQPLTGAHKKYKVFTVGIAARLASEKGFEYLFEAISNFDCQLLIAGPLDPVGEEKYREKIALFKSATISNISFLGPIEPSKMGSFYDQIDVLVLPSINSTESFGIVQVEAMMSGVPVIATDLPGVRIPIRKTGMGIIVRPKSSSDLLAALQEIKSNRSKYIKNQQIIQNEFSIDKVIAFYEQA